MLSLSAVNRRRDLPALLLLLGACLIPLGGCINPQISRNVLVWAVSGGDEISTNTAPNLENDTYSESKHQIRLAAALNEVVDFQVGLTASKVPAGPYQVEVTDLKGPDTLLARDVVTLYRAQYVRVEKFRSWYTTYTGRPATPTLVPDVLVPWSAPHGGGPVTLSEQRNEIVWVDVRVPPTVSPGEYVGAVRVRDAAGSTVFNAELRVEVLPIALPGRRSLPLVCRVDPRDLLETHLRWPRESAEQTRLLPEAPDHFAATRLVNATMQLFEAHRCTPVLWASFPKYRPVGERAVEIDWADYDRIVTPWLDGSAFADRARLETWPYPLDVEYPNAEMNGGLDSPQYARLLATYMTECRRHFEERGWQSRAIVRPLPPEPLKQSAVDRARRISGIVKQSEVPTPLLAHLPTGSLRGLGWLDAPAVVLPEVRIWAPPAMWFEPESMDRERKLGRQTWLMPDNPPYSGSLAVEAPAVDTWTLPWLAYRYDVGGVWLENAASFGPAAPASSARTPWVSAGLIYPAQDFGLAEEGPIPSMRLKRLRRGLQDYELLKLLEANGEALLARKVTEQLVRWGCTDACLDNLLDTKEAGWPARPDALRLARILMLRELAGTFAPSAAARQNQIASLSEWSLMFNQADRVTVAVDGVRLAPGGTGLNARVFASVSNATGRPLEGKWTMPAPPPEWQLTADVPVNVPPGARRSSRMDVYLTGLTYNTEGIYPLEVAFETPALGVFIRPARLAVAACSQVPRAPLIDGVLDDWPLASNNAAGDFRLARGGTTATATPVLPTRAFFSMDHDQLYIAVRAALRAGEPPVWLADNVIPMDGITPWGQDVIEVLIDPRPTAEGSSGDLYSLQVKPTGLLVSRKGTRTEPPMGATESWVSGARAAVKVDSEAWVVEIAVPLDAFGPAARKNNIWGLNVTRLDARRGEYSSWSGPRGFCYSPRALGNLFMLWQ